MITESTMKKSVFALLTAAALVLATGCNTIAGIGRDIEKGGEAIQKSTK
jgi:entericidin B